MYEYALKLTLVRRGNLDINTTIKTNGFVSLH